MRLHRQIHVWITESDYLMLHEQSVEERESVSAILRRMIRNERQRRDDRTSPMMQALEDNLAALQ